MSAGAPLPAFDFRDVATPLDVEIRTRPAQRGACEMSLPSEQTLSRCDVLVIGAGLAGLVAANECERSVILVSRTPIEGSASHHAQGGIAAALDEDDTPALHAEDTLAAGRGLCSPSAVQVLVREGAPWVERLARLGVPFGEHPGLEGGHGRRRVHQVRGAETGRALVAVLAREVRARSNVALAEGERVLSLWMEGDRCVGARTNRRLIVARATIVATGGYAALWNRTTNPSGSRGEGALLAYEAGAALADLELVQFHPTALATNGQLLSEALRGEGATLLDGHGERFVDELAPRDEVARAIHARGGAQLDLREIDRDAFPALIAALAAAGFDPAREPIPVAPAAHYTMGGIATDLSGRSSVRSLYAAGESACTGVHGANRLASNSLLECVVFGSRAAHAASAEPLVSEPSSPPGPCVIETATTAVRDALSHGAGVVRDAAGLGEVARSPHTLARLIAAGALERAESRGSHWRTDVPCEDPALAGHFVQTKGRTTVLEEWQ